MDKFNPGEDTYKSLGARAESIQTILNQFPKKTLEVVQGEFEAANLATPGAVNESVAKLSVTVRDNAAAAIEDLKALDLWLHFKIPEMSDGNNFGVDVQLAVVKEVATLKAELLAMLDAVGTYHQSRAGCLEKIVRPTSTTKDVEKQTTAEKGAKDGDKSTSKETTTEKS